MRRGADGDKWGRRDALRLWLAVLRVLKVLAGWSVRGAAMRVE
jgi:hypothetical protein